MPSSIAHHNRIDEPDNLKEGPMAGNVRARMIDGALQLLARKGLQSTSFAEVTAATSTPRGSIYHHFPNGKQELVLAALDANVEEFRASTQSLPRDNPVAFTEAAIASLRNFLLTNDFKAGCAATAVVAGAENDEQLDKCAAVFDAFFDIAAQGLVESGVEAKPAHEFATMMVCAFCGMTELSRATRNLDAFEVVANGLIERSRGLPLA